MRVAALYDVHGNLPALEAVLADIERIRVDAIVFGGDIAGGPFPAETVERLRALGERTVFIRGNLERELVQPGPPREGGPPPGALDELLAKLTREQVTFLYELPEQQLLEVDGLGRVLCCHATSRNDYEIVTPATPDAHLLEVLADVDADVVVVGHTHMQDDRRAGSVRFVNAGSVGVPYEDAPGAYWALLGPEVELRRTEYDPAALGGYELPHASRAEATAYFEGLRS